MTEQMEKGFEIYPVFTQMRPYGWMRTDSNLIWRSKKECEWGDRCGLKNLTSRSLRMLWVESRRGYELDKKAVADSYNRYYRDGELDLEENQ